MDEMRVKRASLDIDEQFARFVEDEMLPGSGADAELFWATLAKLTERFGDRNRELLRVRDEMQARIDAWHDERHEQPHDADAYRAFLRSIGYIEPECEDFTIEVSGTDREISSIAAPQLVVPATNARFAINATNARWNSLYDALYGTDAIGPPGSSASYDVKKGAEVIAWSKAFLDDIFPLGTGSHADATAYRVVDGALAVELPSGSCGLADPGQYCGYRGDACDAILLVNNGLHVELVFDRQHRVGREDPAGLSDILLESALTTIIDCEDSVAVVDGADKVGAYRNWLGLMRGDLEAVVSKAGRSFTRRINDDRTYRGRDGKPLVLKGRSLLLIRNVGHLMTHPAVRDSHGHDVGEGILDALCTVTIALHDRKGRRRNSAAGSIYIVKPKMHGSDEVRFACEIFDVIEEAIGLPAHSVKIGIMDEERRTTVNLKACIHAARHRVAFINTGFLDRTGDEIHTSMAVGAVPRKEAFKDERWLKAYEDWNVDIGLSCGLGGIAQIGKGMWAKPDLMGAMLAEKSGHPQAGANTAWVPSPTAATLHAIHYHRIDVFARQAEIARIGPRATLDDLLHIPLASGKNWSVEDIEQEVENNLQGILGYVVRWIDQGVGCSKVPDINNVALMEDRATCRISSQHVANWLKHGIVDRDFVEMTLRRMAEVVDRQNAADAQYRPMAPGYDGMAFLAARDLVFKGCEQPSGYTEPILHARRLAVKARN